MKIATPVGILLIVLREAGILPRETSLSCRNLSHVPQDASGQRGGLGQSQPPAHPE